MELQALIKSRLEVAFHPELLKVVDESERHHGHLAHEQGAKHFAIEIKSAVFVGLSRVDIHRKIYALFTDVMPHPLHALKIKCY